MSKTHFVGMFERTGSVPHVARIEIPLFQRDYAQGREEPTVAAIRAAFLSALCGSLRSGADPIALDFVYGEVNDDALVPLDGQQRLTTLFLLHLYVGYRSGHLDADEPWTKFSYATRPGAALFCRTLVEEFARGPNVEAAKSISAWIRDQHWFLYDWQSDPTVQGMLVVIDEIAINLDEDAVDFGEAWTSLTNPEDPAIWFHFLPISDMGAETDLYIKMNSRGKPLTRFENFKAHFEEVIQQSGRREEFARAVDNRWSDLLWRPPKQGDPRDALDERFMRYFEFITDVCQWTAGPTGDQQREEPGARSLDERVVAVFGEGSPDGERERNLEFLFHAFDTWLNDDATTVFSRLFVADNAVVEPGVSDGRVKLFFDRTELFVECCDGYGSNEFSLAQTLLLYATLIHRALPSPSEPSFLRNVRTLRNLIQATNIERRSMPALVPSVGSLIRDSHLVESSGFSQVQVREETAKRQFLDEHDEQPELPAALFGLEDDRLLRGSLAAFSLHVDPTTFIRRARAFHEVFSGPDWLTLSGALLAEGDYGWRRSRGHRQYGTGTVGGHLAAWRVLLTGNDLQDRLTETRRVLMRYLDHYIDQAAATQDPLGFAKHKRAQWLSDREREEEFDWRYYFVRYDTMREDTSGVFHLSEDDHRFVARKLRTGQTHQASKQRDPYLEAIKAQLGADSERLSDPSNVWWVDIWLRVRDSDGVAIKCTAEGFRLALTPAVEEHFARRWAGRGEEPARRGSWGPLEPSDSNWGATHYVNVDDTGSSASTGVDHSDRVRLGTALVRALIAAVDDAGQAEREQ